MTLLVGQNGAGFTQVSMNLAPSGVGRSMYYSGGSGGYLAAATGTMTTAHFFYFDTSGPGNPTAVKVSVYQGAGAGSSTRVATSAAIAIATGDQTGVISGAITAGLLYQLVVQPDVGGCHAVANSGSSGFQCSGNTTANYPYASPPATLPVADYSSQGQEFIVWIDGFTTVVPPSLLFHRKNVLYFI